MSFSPDGKTIVSGSDDNTVRLWDVATRTPIGQPLTGHESSVYSVSFSPDGKTIVSGSGSGVGFANSLGIGDNTVRLWDVTTGTPIGQPLIGRLSVYSVSFSPDGKTLVSGNGDNTLQLWNAVTGKPIGQPLVGHKSPINSVSFSPDGTTLVSGSGSFFGDSDNTVRLWDVTTGTPIGQPLTSHTSMVNSVSFSPDGTTLVSGSSDFTVRLWHISQEKLLQSICNQLRWHPALTIPKTDVEKEAKRTCDRYVWSKEKTSP